MLGWKQKVFLGVLLLAGTLCQGLTMFRSGLLYSFGMGFWGPNGHDGIWHLALANQALSGFPPPHPTFAGATLTNYHYFFDLLLAFFGKITFIPLVNLYFQVLPLLFALGLGILSFLVGFYWQKNFWVGWWLAFFNYFAGSFGFLVTFWRTREIGGESLFWAMQSSSALINPPFALSLIFLLLIIYLLLSIKVWNWKKIVLVGCLLGILPSIKVYAGIIGFSGLLIFAWRKFLKKEVAYAKILSVSCLVAVATFFPINRQPAGLLVFEPFWFIHSMIESPDRLFLPRLASMRQVFQASAYEKLVIIELIGLLIFLVGNLGTRVVALFSLWRKVIEKNLDDLDIFLLVGGFISLLFPLLFIQKGTPWNMIQFFYYFLFFANFYAAVFFARLVATRRIGWLVILVILTIPTTVSSLRGYLGWPPPAAIPPSELEALAFLAKQKDKTVLTYPYDAYLKKDKKMKEPVPLYAYETTAFVSAVSGRKTYLEDEMNLAISGYAWQERRRKVEKFFWAEDQFKARGFLVNNQIGYIYLLPGQEFNFSSEELSVVPIYEKEGVKIYRVVLE